MSKILTMLLSLVLAVFSGLVVLDTLKTLSKAYERLGVVRAQEDKTEALRLANLQGNQELDFVSGDVFVEKEARARYGFIKGDEKIFVLPETVLEQEGIEISTGRTIDKVSPMEEWVQVLFR